MKDLSHLDALLARLARERDRLEAARTQHEADFRKREIAACEKEIAGEYRFLGIPELSIESLMLSDDELLAELMK
jgi:hypothetical protein